MLPTFRYHFSELTKLYVEAKDNVKFLTTLDRHFKNIATGNLTYFRPTFNPIVDAGKTSEMEWVVQANLLGDPELADTVRRPLNLNVVSLTPPKTETDEDAWIVEMLPTMMAMIMYVTILIPASGLLQAVTDEKKNRVMEVLVSSVSPLQLITGKILALGLLGLLQTVLWIGTLWCVARFGGSALGIPTGFSLPTPLLAWALLYFLLGYAMYGVQMAGAGALVPDAKQARNATFLVMGPFILGYIFMVVSVSQPNSPLAVGLSMFPLTAPISMIARMSVTQVPVWQTTLAAALQLLTAIVITRLVARMFRAQLLLSGQAFSFQAYFNALRGRA